MAEEYYEYYDDDDSQADRDLREFAEDTARTAGKIYTEREAIRMGIKSGRFFARAARARRLGRAARLYKAFAKRRLIQRLEQQALFTLGRAAVGAGVSAVGSTVGIVLAIIIVALIFIFILLSAFKQYEGGGGEFVEAGPEAQAYNPYVNFSKTPSATQVENPATGTEEIVYTLEYTNTSLFTLSNFRLNDTKVASPGCSLPAELKPSESFTCTYSYQLGPTDVDSALINDVELIATNERGEEIIAYATARVNVGEAPDDEVPCGYPFEEGAGSFTQGCRSAHATTSGPGKGNAVDYVMPKGTPLKATISGTARRCVDTKSEGLGQASYGIHILLQGASYTLRYAHLMAEDGDEVGKCTSKEVNKGDIIAYSGHTGFSTAPHLHYEIKEDGALLCPNAADANYLEGTAPACRGQ